jgi:aryl-alcohol dehydrogenase
LAQELGATHAIQSDARDPVATIREITGEGVAYSLDTTALPQVFRQAVDALKVGGVCGLIGLSAPGTEVSLGMGGILRGRTIRGIVEGDSIPQIFIPQLIDLYVQGRFPFDRLVAFYPLSRINEAMEDMEQGRTMKPVLRMT